MAAQPETTASLRLVGLDIEGYRSLQKVSWPADGMGWQGIPDIAIVGGANGSGKTTLLEVLYGVVAYMLGWPLKRSPQDAAMALLPRGAAKIRLQLHTGARRTSVEVTSQRLAHDAGPNGYAVWMPPPDESEHPVFMPSTEVVQLDRQRMASSSRRPGPSLLYFPTDRTVPFPAAPYKGPGSRNPADGWVYRYTAPQDWDRSVEAILYDARWKDLNARERGNPGAGHFAAFEQTMRRFLGDTKRFHWDDEGVLHIATRDGALHSLDALSSGEKQVLLFVAELFRRWTPGSLVLLDEPELHLHEAWLATLWTTLCELQRERGGQVILTTQSNYLFGLGEPGSRVLLGSGL